MFSYRVFFSVKSLKVSILSGVLLSSFHTQAGFFDYIQTKCCECKYTIGAVLGAAALGMVVYKYGDVLSGLITGGQGESNEDNSSSSSLSPQDHNLSSDDESKNNNLDSNDDNNGLLSGGSNSDSSMSSDNESSSSSISSSSSNVAELSDSKSDPSSSADNDDEPVIEASEISSSSSSDKKVSDNSSTASSNSNDINHSMFVNKNQASPHKVCSSSSTQASNSSSSSSSTSSSQSYINNKFESKVVIEPLKDAKDTFTTHHFKSNLIPNSGPSIELFAHVKLEPFIKKKIKVVPFLGQDQRKATYCGVQVYVDQKYIGNFADTFFDNVVGQCVFMVPRLKEQVKKYLRSQFKYALRIYNKPNNGYKCQPIQQIDYICTLKVQGKKVMPYVSHDANHKLVFGVSIKEKNGKQWELYDPNLEGALRTYLHAFSKDYKRKLRQAYVQAGIKRMQLLEAEAKNKNGPLHVAYLLPLSSNMSQVTLCEYVELKPYLYDELKIVSYLARDNKGLLYAGLHIYRNGKKINSFASNQNIQELMGTLNRVFPALALSFAPFIQTQLNNAMRVYTQVTMRYQCSQLKDFYWITDRQMSISKKNITIKPYIARDQNNKMVFGISIKGKDGAESGSFDPNLKEALEAFCAKLPPRYYQQLHELYVQHGAIYIARYSNTFI